jgi:hypothetical protein
LKSDLKTLKPAQRNVQEYMQIVHGGIVLIEYKISKYEQYIHYHEGIIKINCSCADFQFRKLADAKLKNEPPKPCKHLIQAINLIDPEIKRQIGL